jgi:trk system potassium uptake protein TrkA
MKRFVIIGLGIFGSTVARTLFESGAEVVAVDKDPSLVDKIASHVTRAAAGDVRDIATLDRLGARDADAAVVSTGDDISASILAVLALQDLGVKEIHVKVVSHDHARVMRKFGVSNTSFPERDSAENLANLISYSKSLLNYVRLGEDFGLQEMAVPGSWEGKTLRALEIRQRYNVSIVAIHDMLTDQMLPATDPDAVLKVSDTLMLAGKSVDLEQVARVS